MSLIDTNAEIKRHNSSITTQLEVASIQSFIDDAENNHLIPAIGRAAFDALVAGKADYADGSKEKTLLLALQKACVNFALHYYSDNGGLIIDNAGIAVLTSTTKRPASDKKLISFKRQAFNSAHNSLELAVSFLEANIADFAIYAASDERVENRSRFINTSREFPQKIPVTAALYTRLKAIISKEEETIIFNMLGDDLLTDIRTKFLANNLTPTEKTLVTKIRHVIGSNAIRKGITYGLVDVEATGSYVHRDTVGGISGNVENRDPAELDRLKPVMQQLACDYESDLERLRIFLKDNVANLTGYTAPTEVVVNDPDSNVYLM
ncbi:DUF6712 family protein [Paradesertivirga mongoliensis]|uniref:DUF6712 family protein n=1 Tax=Paradesertivirga mongoliensis TaxID=2100740 RepID=A0ABW4ZNN1_9SPHI|nr:DUF6712 family protein [Pedobacter mongoliensis]